MKIVINSCYGGFNISTDALIELVKRNAKCINSCTPKNYYGGENENYYRRNEWEDEWNKDFKEYEKIEIFLVHPLGFNIYKDGLLYDFVDNKISRIDKDLIEVIESIGEKSFGKCAKLKIIEIPDDIEYEIEEYDGIESVHEVHRSWS